MLKQKLSKTMRAAVDCQPGPSHSVGHGLTGSYSGHEVPVAGKSVSYLLRDRQTVAVRGVPASQAGVLVFGCAFDTAR